MNVARYMALCLTHPTYGYYTTRDPLGAQGDFTTAPEISPLFGEMIGAWLVHAWENLGAPQRFTLLECGPGRGTLMDDILRVAKLRPDFIYAMQLHLTEASPVLQGLQNQLLGTYSPSYVETVADLPEQPLFCIANEFFDALPIRQFARDGQKWSERVIGLSETGLTFGFVPAAKQDSAEDFYETSPASQQIWSVLCDKIKTHGGAGLMIDYGDNNGKSGNTLQAVKAHQKVDVLQTPGEADLTAYVDFAVMHGIASEKGLQADLATQGEFLIDLGITERLQQVIAARPDLHEDAKGAFQRLVADDQMGQLFKVLGVWHDDAVSLPGF